MPRMDETGPLGQGPLTGRGLGPCGGGLAQGKQAGAGVGAGRGFGRGMGRGLGRPLRCRNIWSTPDTTYFKPAGVRLVDLEDVEITLDEAEALRLIDLEDVEQEKAAKKMAISQPTLSRILTSARKKIADAITNGKAIKISGGSYKVIGKNKTD